MNLLQEIKHRFREALAPLVSDPASALEMIRPAQDARFGDYQANCAMPLGKQLGQPPREIAQQIVSRLQITDLGLPPEIAGPGFINLRIRDDWLQQQLQDALADDRLGVAQVDSPRTYVIDYSAPNVAKPMHVGHIRSTVIGDALCRTLRFLGHQVISDNHLGDWGTQFGMVIYGYRHFLDRAAYERDPVAELGRIYRVVRRILDYHDALRQRPVLQEQIDQLQQLIADGESQSIADKQQQKQAAKLRKRQQSQLEERREQLAALNRRIAEVEADPHGAQQAAEHAQIYDAVLEETAKLHAGDPDNLKLWHDFLPKCRQEIQRIYDRLDIAFDVELGESFYQDRLASVVEDLLQRDQARESEGAICVFLEDFATPMIIRKKDGAFLYATTDLATIQYRMQQWSPDAILYVVDFRQSEHFDKLFAAARNWGYQDVELRHVEFGTVLGPDNKPFKTRAGDTVGLEGLLDAAVQRALEVVSANDDAKPDGRELSDDQRAHIAHAIGHAAIKYADLSQNRSSDYVYSEEKMVALRGNTATYLQYSYARVMNIFAKGQVDISALRSSGATIELQQPQERRLGLQLVRLSEALEEVVLDYRPNHLTNYLFELATLFSEFYEACPVLKAETEDQRDSRLLLCDLVARTLKLGLSLLGIQVVDKM